MNVLDNIKKNAHDSGFAEGYEKGYEKGFKKGVDASVKVILYGVIQFLGDKRGWTRRSIFEAIRWLHKHSEMILEDYTTFDEVVEAVRSEYGIMPKDSDFMDESFLEYCYEQGRKSTRLYSEYGSKGSKEDERIMLLLCRIIKTVINLEV